MRLAKKMKIKSMQNMACSLLIGMLGRSKITCTSSLRECKLDLSMFTLTLHKEVNKCS